MSPKARSIAPSIVLLVFLAGCGEKSPAPEAEKPLAGSFASKEAAASKHPQRLLDPDSLRHMSNLLAGHIQEGDADRLDAVWLDHARQMDDAWEKIDARMEAMRAWTAREKPAAGHEKAPLVYPFGGPDLITAMQFFPQAASYLLIGLEAPGHLPGPDEFSAEVLADDLDRLRRPFKSFTKHGYFVRNEIDKDLSGGSFDGVLPILLVCLVRDGKVPVSLQYIAIDPETYAITPLGPDSESATAVAIHFVDREAHPAEGAPAEELPEGEAKSVEVGAVYYFAQDLSNDGLFSDEPFSRLIQRQESVNTYMKSAEYLLHTENFSNFRKLLLKKTQTLLQDDSGIPIRHLTSDTWDVRLYGSYTSVLAAYSHWLQEDLVAAYARGKDIGELGFGLGYNSKHGGGALILGNRKTPEEG